MGGKRAFAAESSGNGGRTRLQSAQYIPGALSRCGRQEGLGHEYADPRWSPGFDCSANLGFPFIVASGGVFHDKTLRPGEADTGQTLASFNGFRDMRPPSSCLRLRPPLRSVWSHVNGLGAAVPLVSPSTSYLVSVGPRKSLDHAAVALESTTGRKLWSHKPKAHRRSSPGFLLPDRIGIIDTSANEAQADDDTEDDTETLVLDGRTGKLIRRYPWAGTVVVGNMCVGDAISRLWVGSLTTGRKLWDVDFGPNPGQWLSGPFLEDRFWASKHLLVWGRKGGAVRCVRTRTGEVVWETSVADIWWPGATPRQRIPGEVKGRIQCFGRVLTLPTATHVVGVSLDTGDRLWAVEAIPLRGGGRCGDRLYVSYCAWIDPQSGEYHGEPAGRLVGPAKLERPKEWKPKKDTFSGDFLVSETHIFGTSTAATLEAWDRETGKHEWHEKPEGANGYVESAPMVAAYGRLYYVDSSFRTYCYEEENPSDHSSKARPAMRAKG